jgi:2-oxoglutarate ferredoxin oxidoreductase subunit delta
MPKSKILNQVQDLVQKHDIGSVTNKEGKVNFGLTMSETKKKKETPKIDIFKAWCKGCGICVAFCPTGVLAKDEAGTPYVKDIEKCINCGWCEIRCPDFAITVEAETKGKKRVEVKGGKEEAKPREEEISPERIVAPGE